MNLQDKIEHVFVLMLENHSFDNIFGNSGLPGIAVANSKNYNSYNKNPYYFQGNAPTNMPTDPGHEFLDVVEQLSGTEASKNYKGGKYPPIKPLNQKGFAANYATSTSEGTGVPSPDEVKDIMKGFDTETQLPVTYQLATEFGICDQWHASLPGPTWPNRYFVHGGSSAGLDHSPKNEDVAKWEFLPWGGFEYQHGSIYDRLNDKNIDWNLYQDKSLSVGGQIPQVASIKGIHQVDVHSLSLFYLRLKLSKHLPYKAKYTFIEPNYGDVYKTYKHGSSQHPMDGVARGEQLIKDVYEAIRNSSIWEKSLLIITYDEHGGFYDHASPPKAVPPGDKTMFDNSNKYGFEFDQYGVRVPALIISPYIRKGSVSHKIYDHSSVIRTLHEVHNEIGHLTDRDKGANHVGELLSLDQPRQDCPTHLNVPAFTEADNFVPDPKAEEPFDSEPLPAEGNFIGFLYVLLKSKLALSDGSKESREAILADFNNLKTRGEARGFGDEVKELVDTKQIEAMTQADTLSQNLFFMDKALEGMGKAIDPNLFFSIVNHLGPAAYNQDAAHVACSDPSELNTVKKNFLINKLGMEDSPQLDEMIQDVCQKMGKSNRRKNRAIFYYLLTVMLEKESVFA